MNEITKAQIGKMNETELNKFFTEVYKEMLPQIDMYLRTKTSNEELRSEVISQTFIKVYNGLKTGKFDENKGEFNPDKKIKMLSWVHTIAKNALIDEIRKNKDRNLLVHISDYTDENGREFFDVAN